MKISKLRLFFIKTTCISIFLAMVLVAGCAPKTVETVDVRQGDTMDIQMQNGATGYKGLIPAFVLDGTSRYILNISATFKITNIIDTRTVLATSTSSVQIVGQNSSQPIKVVLYLCTPLSEKATKASNGNIIFTGNGYPDIIEGHDYIISGILQPNWQSVPLIYVASGYNIKEVTKDETFFYAPEEQFNQDVASLIAKKTVKDFLGYWNTKNLIAMEKLLSSKKQGIDWETGKVDYVKLINISEFYTEEVNTKTFVAVFDFKYKKGMGGSMNGGITYWNFTLKRENDNSPWLIQDWGGGGNTY